MENSFEDIKNNFICIKNIFKLQKAGAICTYMSCLRGHSSSNISTYKLFFTLKKLRVKKKYFKMFC